MTKKFILDIVRHL